MVFFNGPQACCDPRRPLYTLLPFSLQCVPASRQEARRKRDMNLERDRGDTGPLYIEAGGCSCLTLTSISAHLIIRVPTFTTGSAYYRTYKATTQVMRATSWRLSLLTTKFTGYYLVFLQSLTRLFFFYKYCQLCGPVPLLWPEWLKLIKCWHDTPHTQSSTQADAAMVGRFLQGNEQHKVSHLMPFVQEDTTWKIV